ncbi:MAG TPA: SDR family NAD(P)-dependent oxidoreductase [Terracidiphilus sp.]|nr:SDR family NAD(P)-dependent oxidoreductase [Terracidiphilus sp.]
MTKEEDWAAVVAATTRHFGKLDVLVNNAGISGSAEQDFTAPKPGTGSWRLTRPVSSSA